MFEAANRIICDYVRQEAGGTYTCIGVYPHASIMIEDFSVPVKVSLYIEITSTDYGLVDAHFILEDRASSTIFNSFPARVKLNGWTTPPLATYPMEIKARGPCVVRFSAIAGDRKIDLALLTI